MPPTPPKPGSKQEEALQLVCRWQDHGDVGARERLIAMHIPLVGAVISRYPGAKRSPEAKEEATSAGLVGLLIACEKFNREKSNSFGAYATLWVRATILQLLRDNRLIKLTSRHGRKLWFGIGRAQRELEAKGITPTPETIAAHVGVPVDAAANVLASFAAMVSFDAPTMGRQGDKPRALADTLPTDEAPADARYEESERERRLSTGVYRALGVLNARERFVIERRHLVEPEEALSLRACGEHIGVSGERVRQIERSAFDKMRPWLAELEAEGEVA